MTREQAKYAGCFNDTSNTCIDLMVDNIRADGSADWYCEKHRKKIADKQGNGTMIALMYCRSGNCWFDIAGKDD